MKGNTVPDTSFKDAYGVLQRHAETLRVQDEPNIDDLLTIVTESVTAYQVCKQRIAAVETALKAALDGVGADGPGAPAAPVTAAMSASSAHAAPAAPSVTVKPARSRSASVPAPAVAPPVQAPAPAASSGRFEDMDDDIPF